MKVTYFVVFEKDGRKESGIKTYTTPEERVPFPTEADIHEPAFDAILKGLKEESASNTNIVITTFNALSIQL